ncbi:MAG: hypothetical protein DRG30_01415 [Epsilonproteobacteria bacterium]|nr:MAG: hypothetical protein DRG30_01415 [Campylobacterota bacterium]
MTASQQKLITKETRMNSVNLIGNITRDIELTYAQSGTAIAKFGMAMNKSVKNQSGGYDNKPIYVDLTAFGKTAETLNQYFRKGKKIAIEGELNFEQWTAQDGQKRSKLSVTVNRLHFVEPKEQGQQQGGQQPQQQQQGQTYQPQGQQQYGQQQQQPAQYNGSNNQQNNQPNQPQQNNYSQGQQQPPVQNGAQQQGQPQQQQQQQQGQQPQQGQQQHSQQQGQPNSQQPQQNQQQNGYGQPAQQQQQQQPQQTIDEDEIPF